jgi:hypothetical protein
MKQANNFPENLDACARSRWASISVLAHEIGHHYIVIKAHLRILDVDGSADLSQIER